jgi:hypothetical protein
MRRPKHNIDVITGCAYSIAYHRRIFRKHSSRSWSFRRFRRVTVNDLWKVDPQNAAANIGSDLVGAFVERRAHLR